MAPPQRTLAPGVAIPQWGILQVRSRHAQGGPQTTRSTQTTQYTRVAAGATLHIYDDSHVLIVLLCAHISDSFASTSCCREHRVYSTAYVAGPVHVPGTHHQCCVIVRDVNGMQNLFVGGCRPPGPSHSRTSPKTPTERQAATLRRSEKTLTEGEDVYI